LYAALSQEIKDTKPGKKVVELLENKKKSEEASKSTAVGAKAPDFSGPNPEGKTIALSEVMGKATLIDFWAAWCRPCRAENPNIVAVYKKYHDKGLNIVGVSLDRTEEAWKKAIADDGLEWHQISNIAYFDDQIAQLYNVSAIPAAFLLDENGVIVAKNLRGPELEAKVAELLD
jgi:peroxiredoxin